MLMICQGIHTQTAVCSMRLKPTCRIFTQEFSNQLCITTASVYAAEQSTSLHFRLHPEHPHFSAAVLTTDCCSAFLNAFDL